MYSGTRLGDVRLEIHVDRRVAELARGEHRNGNDPVLSAGFGDGPGGQGHLGGVELEVPQHPPEGFLRRQRQIDEIDPLGLDPAFAQRIGPIVRLARQGQFKLLHASLPPDTMPDIIVSQPSPARKSDRRLADIELLYGRATIARGPGSRGAFT
jgi:hypothetical protein